MPRSLTVDQLLAESSSDEDPVEDQVLVTRNLCRKHFGCHVQRAYRQRWEEDESLFQARRVLTQHHVSYRLKYSDPVDGWVLADVVNQSWFWWAPRTLSCINKLLEIHGYIDENLQASKVGLVCGILWTLEL